MLSLPLFLLSVLMPGFTTGESHSLRYLYTGVFGIPEFPEYVSMGYVDDHLITKYDSISQRYELRAQWLAENVDEAYLKYLLQLSQNNHQRFKRNVRTVMDRTNQTSSIHSLQVMYGCSMNGGTSSGFHQYGYDGQDYIAFDEKTQTWIAATPSATFTTDRWNPDPAYIMQTKEYLEQTCIEWLHKYIKYGQTSLGRKVPPKAKMTDKTESDSTKLKCRVSGFYPKDIDVYFVKGDNDRIEVTASTGVLPNYDGTYYTEKWVEVDPQDKCHHSCHVDHVGLESKLILKLDPESNTAFIVWIIIAAVALILIAGITVVVSKVKRKDDKHYTPAKCGTQYIHAKSNDQNTLQSCIASFLRMFKYNHGKAVEERNPCEEQKCFT